MNASELKGRCGKEEESDGETRGKSKVNSEVDSFYLSLSTSWWTFSHMLL